MKLLITGGAGFIGSNFIQHILKERGDVQVVNLDLLSYAGNLDNLADVFRDSRYTFLHGDIAESRDVEACLNSHQIDIIVNFAAETHVDRSIVDSSAFVRTNLQGTQILLEAARRKKIGRFVQISTDEVYGSLGPTGKFSEQSPLAPNSPYAASKAGADLMVQAYHHTYGIHVNVTRCSNNYGPFQFPEKLIPLMTLNALEDMSLPVYGDGLYTRDWIHVKDHCRAVERVVFDGRPGQTYNIGGNQEKRNLDVVHRILDILGKSRELIQFVDDRPGHDRRYAIDASRIGRELNWSPQISFEDGLAETIRWYRQNPDWVKRVRSGAYLDFYREMYEDRRRMLSEL
ncbi:MAG: dTDP-glucose 4,6-dehydratase [Acidobacteriota bacterium]